MMRPMESPALGTKMQIKSAMAEAIPNVSQEVKTGYPVIGIDRKRQKKNYNWYGMERAFRKMALLCRNCYSYIKLSTLVQVTSYLQLKK